MFLEQDQSPKTNLRMFKFDNKLIKKKNIVMGMTRAHNMIINKEKCFEKKYALVLKITFNCLPLFFAP